MRARLLPTLVVALVALAGCSDERTLAENGMARAARGGPADVGPPVPVGPPAPPQLRPAERLGLVTGWGPTAGELDRAARLAGGLPLPDLAGQVIVADWAGTHSPTRLVRELHLGGVIAFADNLTSTGQVRAVTTTLARAAQRPWPLFIGVDQEGGVVERVKARATRFPSFMSAGAARDPTLTRAAAEAGGAELRGLGFTVDFAPVADVTSGPGDPTIGSRSVGSSPALVATQATAAAEGLLAAGVVPVLKHFPGHGSVPSDSHLGLPVQSRTLAQLRESDLRPFRAGIDRGVPAVMVGHLDIRAVDPGTPSSLSRRVVMGLLRSELGFDGLVVTDSLQMAAVQTRVRGGPPAVEALLAGSDVVLMPPDPASARAAIVRAVREGRLSRGRLEQAAARQIALLLHHRAVPGSAPGSGRRASRALSAAALTVVAGRCGGRLVGRAVSPVGDPSAVAAFTAAARTAGLPVSKRGTRIAFARGAAAPVRAPVTVAVDTPYALGRSRSPVRIATYGTTPGAMAALLDLLTGAVPAPGRLPVAVPGAPRSGC